MSATPRVEPTPSEPPRGFGRAQFGLAAVILGLAVLLGVRAYLPDRARPTDHRPGVARQVDLNRADRSELLNVPGIGPNLADAILTHRQTHGQFERVDDLQSVKGVGEKNLAKVRPWLTVSEKPSEVDETRPERLERKPIARAVPEVSGKPAKIRAGEAPIDVNEASAVELQRLTGIGPVLAAKIIEARERKPFRAIDDLRGVSGIGAKILESIRPFVVVKPKL